MGEQFDYTAHADAMRAARPTKRFGQRSIAILDAAAPLFNKYGLKGTTFAQVAEQVGLSSNSVTYYFRKKEDLAAACMQRSIDILEDIISSVSEEPTRALRIQNLVQSYAVKLAEVAIGEHPDFVTFHDIRALNNEQGRSVSKQYNEMFRHLRNVLYCDCRHEVPHSQKNAKTYLILSVLHGMRDWVDQYEPADYGLAAQRVVDILLNGFAGLDNSWSPSPLPVATRGDPISVSHEAFLRAATVLINEHGYRGASVEKISTSLHVTKGSFYHHIEGKDNLVDACFERSFDVIRCVQNAALSLDASGWARLCSVMHELVRYQLSEHGPLLRYTALSALPVEQRTDKHSTMDRLARRFSTFITDGTVDHSIRPIDPVIGAYMVNTVVNASTHLAHWIPDLGVENAPDYSAKLLLCGEDRMW
jgi:AcrR family transcriptional regulator